MLRALVDHGVRPDVIVGTSVGALNGAFLAIGARPGVAIVPPRARSPCTRPTSAGPPS
jgi:hypothetical protein